MPEGPGTILGGLPVVAEVDFGKDADTPNGPGEYWAEVREICWQKRDGAKGKPIPQHISDRAEDYDPYFATLIEQVEYHLIHEADLKRDTASGIEAPSGVETAETGSIEDESPVPPQAADAQKEI